MKPKKTTNKPANKMIKAVPTKEPYDVISADLQINRIRREIVRYCYEQHISDHDFLRSVDMITFQDHAAQHMVQRLVAKVASKKYDVKTVRFPGDWWQAVKRRFFPAWALTRWPVTYTEVTMEANAYHPDVSIPDHSTFVEILMAAKHGL